jgi:hypothetical protein
MSAPIPAPVPSLAPIYPEKRPITLSNPDHFFWQPTFDADGQLIPPSVDLMKPGSASTYFVSPPASSDATWGRLARVEPTPSEVAAVLDAHFSAAPNLRFPHSARPALDRDLLDSMSRVQQDYDPKVWQAVLRYWRSKYEHGLFTFASILVLVFFNHHLFFVVGLVVTCQSAKLSLQLTKPYSPKFPPQHL